MFYVTSKLKTVYKWHVQNKYRKKGGRLSPWCWKIQPYQTHIVRLPKIGLQLTPERLSGATHEQYPYVTSNQMQLFMGRYIQWNIKKMKQLHKKQ